MPAKIAALTAWIQVIVGKITMPFFLQVKNIKYIEVDPLPVSKQYFLFKNSEILQIMMLI